MRKNPPNEREFFDVVIATDFRVPGGTNHSTIQEIKAQSNVGLCTGLMHIPRYENLPTRPMLPNYRELVDGEHVQVLTFGDEIDTDLVIFRWPPALAHRPTFLPNVQSDNVRIVSKPDSGKGDVAKTHPITTLKMSTGTSKRYSKHVEYGLRLAQSPVRA